MARMDLIAQALSHLNELVVGSDDSNGGGCSSTILSREIVCRRAGGWCPGGLGSASDMQFDVIRGHSARSLRIRIAINAASSCKCDTGGRDEVAYCRDS